MIDITREVFNFNAAKINGEHSPAFRAHWDKGYSIVKILDVDYRLVDLLGDTFNPLVNTDIDAKKLKREERKEVARIKTEGVYGIGLALNGTPLYSSFCWGFVGNDFLGGGYDADLIQALNARPIKEEF